MSIHAMSWAIKVKGLPIATKAVLMMLADCHNGETGQCNPSLRHLMELTGLKERALQLHLKAIEEAGFMTRQYVFHGRGKGCSVEQYALKIGILGTVMGPKDIAPAKECARKIRSMEPQNIAVAYKEEPEKNQNTPLPPKADAKADRAKVLAEDVWKLLPSRKRKLTTQAKVARAIAKTLKVPEDGEALLSAARACYGDPRNTEDGGQYAPAVVSWIADGVWRNWVPQVEPQTPLTEAEWATAMRHWVDTREWLAGYISPAPDEPGCQAPLKMLRHAAKLRPELAEQINQNLREDKAA